MSKQRIEQLFDLSGKSVVVTGGAVGIGKGIASWLAEAGARVMLTDIDMEAADRTVEEIRAEGGTAEAIRADAGSPADARKVVAAVQDAFGGLDVLVNNADIYPMSPFLSTTEELWDRVMNIMCSSTTEKAPRYEKPPSRTTGSGTATWWSPAVSGPAISWRSPVSVSFETVSRCG